LQRAEAQRERDALLDQGLTNSPLLPRLNARVNELNAQISEQKRRLVNPGGGSLASTINQYEGASARKEIAQARWQSTLNTLQQAYLRILEQRRYFVIIVGMSAPTFPAVRDLLGIAVPILLLLAFIYAAVLALRAAVNDLVERVFARAAGNATKVSAERNHAENLASLRRCPGAPGRKNDRVRRTFS